MTPPATTPDSRVAWLQARGEEALAQMHLIREVDGRLESYIERNLIGGSTHPAVGMEAVAVGAGLSLSKGDTIFSTHRGHGHCLARGARPDRLLAELFGRELGYCGGKGGSMHLAVRELGILGTNAIVGSSIGLATGAALASRLSGDGCVSVAFFGEGAINQGIFHESLNLAAIWRLPCLYVCENNHYAQSAAVSDMCSVDELHERARAYGIPGVAVDGMDVVAVWEAASRAVARAKDGQGPSLLVADTWRYLGHMVGDTEIYRSDEAKRGWADRDPIRALEAELTAAGISDAAGLDAVRVSIAKDVDEAEALALGSAAPSTETAFTDVAVGGSLG